MCLASLAQYYVCEAHACGACDGSSFAFTVDRIFCCVTPFIYSLEFNCTAVNFRFCLLKHPCLQILGCIPRSGTIGSEGIHCINFIK